ncbi:hypothetical protein HID58_090840 [Brassica napus]|uniref:NB-ARC domain-containing protein n=1 Tax=Brassica napus TaxID=3708 RepID=A0ABQ7XB95_BRANA|nr:hypothetical protein HID58_090840 [Brassica napus]
MEDNEADMVENIATDVSKKLTQFRRSIDFNYDLVGMGSHLEEMRRLLYLDSDEVRMIGIWGLPGVGKSTITRFLFKQLSQRFNFPKDGYEDLARRVCNIAGRLPLRLKIMGSYFRGMSKQEWIDKIDPL